MAEYIEKWSVVNRLIDLENEFQQYKPFHGFEHAMYRKIREVEIAIGKTPSADVAPVVRCKDCAKDGLFTCPICFIENKTLQFINHSPDFYCGEGERRADG